VDVGVTDTDTKAYAKRAPAKFLKTLKYLKPCLENRHHFTPFVCSVDGLLGREAKTFAKRLAAKLATKWKQPYAHRCVGTSLFA
jgi:hypothetical protein